VKGAPGGLLSGGVLLLLCLRRAARCREQSLSRDEQHQREERSSVCFKHMFRPSLFDDLRPVRPGCGLPIYRTSVSVRVAEKVSPLTRSTYTPLDSASASTARRSGVPAGSGPSWSVRTRRPLAS